MKYSFNTESYFDDNKEALDNVLANIKKDVRFNKNEFSSSYSI